MGADAGGDRSGGASADARGPAPPVAAAAAPGGIGTRNEGPLHAALKRWYARPGDPTEVWVDGYWVDVVQGSLLVEIQTGGFSAIRRKLDDLSRRHRVRLVTPIACERWIRRPGARPRRSPWRGGVEDVFVELVSFPRLLRRPRFSIEALLVREEEVRRPARRRARRRFTTVERRLLEVVARRRFQTPAQLAALVPTHLAEPFTTADLAAALGRPRWLAQKMAYCLREMGALERAGKQGNAVLYRRVAPSRRSARPRAGQGPVPAGAPLPSAPPSSAPPPGVVVVSTRSA